MDAAKEAQIKAHALALAELLYDETDPEQVKTLAGIEVGVRDHLLEYVGPEIGNFLSAQAAAQVVGESDTSRGLSDG
jgi:hypothetical protein